jgi:hypothetical protein
MTKRFPTPVLVGLAATKYLRIRAGDHRFIPVWVVVVEGRAIVRSWNDKPGGWYRAFLLQPHGQVQVDGREISIRALPLRSKWLNDAADDAYGAKYTTKAAAKFVDGFRTPRRKATTLELVPA